MSNNFFAIEGTDGSGKTTCIKGVAERLEAIGLKVKVVREPGGGLISEHIRSLLVNGFPGTDEDPTDVTSALLFNASRSELVNKTIMPLLKEGYVVIADRFVDSTLVYQGHLSKWGDHNGSKIKRLMDLHDLVIGLNPLTTFLIKCDPEVALKRTLIRKETNKLDPTKIEIMEDLSRGYQRVMGMRGDKHQYVTLDNSSDSPESVIEAITKHIEKRVMENVDSKRIHLFVEKFNRLDLLGQSSSGLPEELSDLIINSDSTINKKSLKTITELLGCQISLSKTDDLGRVKLGINSLTKGMNKIVF